MRRNMPFFGKALVVLFFFLFRVHGIGAGCPDDDPKLTYRILDEFGDERTILITGGTIEVTCHSKEVEFIYLYKLHFDPIKQSPGDVKIERETDRTILTLRISSGFFTKKLLLQEGRMLCACSQNKNKLTYLEAFKYAVCGQREHAACGGKELCLLTVRHSNQGKCRKDYQCPKQLDKLEYSYKICGALSTLSDTECDAVKKALTTDDLEDWPMVQILKNESGCSKSNVNFWEGDWTLRHNILVNESFTLRPKSIPACNDQRVRCHLKFLNDFQQKQPQEKDLTGNCSNGWRVEVEQISSFVKTKLVCRNGQRSLQWQFLLLNTVKIERQGSDVMCIWPKWMGIPETKAENNYRCHKEATFAYPISQKSTSFQITAEKTTTPPPTTTETAPTTTTTSSTSTETTPTTPTTTTTTTSNTTAGTAENTGERSTSTLWWIIGSVVVGIILLTGIVVAIILIKRRQSRKKEKEKKENEKELSDREIEDIVRRMSGRLTERASRARRKSTLRTVPKPLIDPNADVKFVHKGAVVPHDETTTEQTEITQTPDTQTTDTEMRHENPPKINLDVSVYDVSADSRRGSALPKNVREKRKSTV